MEVKSRPGTAQNRRLAIAFGMGLAGFAALAYTVAALLDFTLGPGQTLDPHRRGFAVAGGFAAALCIVALGRLGTVARGRTGWGGAAFWLALAVVALLVLVAVAFASRLGG